MKSRLFPKPIPGRAAGTAALGAVLAVTATGCPKVIFKNPFSTGSDPQSVALGTADETLAVTLLSPSSGSGLGGTAVTIRGRAFLPGASVAIGGQPCTGVTWVSTTELRCTTPAHGGGNVPVSVANPDGSASSLAAAFTYTFGANWIGAALLPSSWSAAPDLYLSDADGAFEYPQGMAVDSIHGHLFVADPSKNRVQKFDLATGAFLGAIGRSVTSTGTCPTDQAAPGWCTGGLFGSGSGPGMFSYPYSVGLDVAGNRLYVADRFNHRVQRFDLATGAFVDSIGSSGTADGQFSSPQAVAVDPSGGMLYVGDDNRVQKFNLSTGAFVGGIGSLNNSFAPYSTTAWCVGCSYAYNSRSGNTDAAFSFVRSLAVDPVGNALYVLDSSRVVKINLATGAFVEAFGKISGGGATCPQTSGFTGGWCGSLGAVSLTSGSEDGALKNPAGMAIDLASDRLYVADTQNARVQSYVLSTGAVVGSVGVTTASAGTCPSSGQTSSWCTGGTFNTLFPGAIALDPASSKLFVADYGKVMRFDSATGARIDALGVGSSVPAGWHVSSSALAAGASKLSDGAFSSPQAVQVDGVHGYLYVVHPSMHRVERYSLATGLLTGAIGKSTFSSGACATSWCINGAYGSGSGDGMFSYPMSLALDISGDALYVVDAGNFRVQRFVLSTGQATGSIGYVSSTGGTCTSVGPSQWCTGGTFDFDTSAGAFSDPLALAVDPVHDALYVTEDSTGRIQKFRLSTGAYLTDLSAGYGNGDGMVDSGTGVAVDPAHNMLYVADPYNSRIEKFDAGSGAFVGAIGYSLSSSGTCPGASGVVGGWCTGGDFWPSGGDGGFDGATGVAVDAASGVLYVADTGNHRLQKFDLATGSFLGALGAVVYSSGTCPSSGVSQAWCSGGAFAEGRGDGMMRGPVGVAMNPLNGLLYVVDRDNHRIQQIAVP